MGRSTYQSAWLLCDNITSAIGQLRLAILLDLNRIVHSMLAYAVLLLYEFHSLLSNLRPKTPTPNHSVFISAESPERCRPNYIDKMREINFLLSHSIADMTAS